MSREIQVTVDIVVFSVIHSKLQVLLIKRKYDPFKGRYAIPGGFVKPEETLEEAARRELMEETGIKDIFIKKLTAYGGPQRDPRGNIVTIVFLALIDAVKFQLKADTDALTAEWIPLDTLGHLAFDHDQILRDALKELRLEIQTTNIAAHMLPDTFTLTELQTLYESLLSMPLDKRNFRKRIAALNILIPAKGRLREGAHRPAQLYSFRSKEYQSLKDRVHVFV